MFKLWDYAGITGFGLICSFVGIFALLIASIDQYSAWRCSNYGEMSEREVNYINFDSCYVSVNDKWIRYDSAVRKNFDGEL